MSESEMNKSQNKTTKATTTTITLLYLYLKFCFFWYQKSEICDFHFPFGCDLWLGVSLIFHFHAHCIISARSAAENFSYYVLNVLKLFIFRDVRPNQAQVGNHHHGEEKKWQQLIIFTTSYEILRFIIPHFSWFISKLHTMI